MYYNYTYMYIIMLSDLNPALILSEKYSCVGHKRENFAGRQNFKRVPTQKYQESIFLN